jgi:allantoicase
MIGVIEDERIHPARPTLNNIANSLGEPEELVNNPGRELEIGIGNVQKLNEKAKHWELINVGGTYTTKETHVVPTTYFAGAKSDFITFKAGSTHTIEGIEFVYKSIQNLEKELKETITELGGSFISGLSKASK